MWKKYVPVWKRREKAEKKIKQLEKKGINLRPISVQGRRISTKFWGKLWCEHVETFSDYCNRLPRGRTYVRNGSVLDLSISQESVEAKVMGSKLYSVEVSISPLKEEKWELIKERCAGEVGSILEVLQGKISEHVMEVVSDPQGGLFPLESEIKFECSCPDWAGMCKHVAAVLYGIGNRLDDHPDLLFLLRGVDVNELMSTDLSLTSEGHEDAFVGEELSEIFDIEIESEADHLALKGEEVVAVTNEVEGAEIITGDQIKLLRKMMGMGVKEFANSIEVTSASINRWEKTSEQVQLSYQQEMKVRSFAKICLKEQMEFHGMV